MRENRRGWRKRNKELRVFSMLHQEVSFLVGVRWFWVWGSLVSGWGTMMEESRWRIKAGLIAYGLQIHLHLLKGDPWGSLASPQAKPPISSAAIVWIWRMRPSRPSPLTEPASVSRFRGRIIHCDIIMEHNTYKFNINLLIFNINCMLCSMARYIL